MIARLRKFGTHVQIGALVLGARLAGRLPIPDRIKKPLVRWLGIRVFLLVLGQKMNTVRLGAAGGGR